MSKHARPRRRYTHDEHSGRLERRLARLSYAVNVLTAKTDGWRVKPTQGWHRELAWLHEAARAAVKDFAAGNLPVKDVHAAFGALARHVEGVA